MNNQGGRASRVSCWQPWFVCFSLAVVGLVPWSAAANPEGGIVTPLGRAAIERSGNTTTITQQDRKVIIDWQSFSIGANEVTRFVQPDARSIALNRVVGKEPSRIDGQLQANGQVWLINRSGVLFGPTARVDVQGLLATTANIASDSQFLNPNNDRYAFDTPSPELAAAIVNHGQISLKQSGLAALVAPHVRNDGVIEGRLAQVVIAGAPTYTIALDADGLIRFAAFDRVTQVADRSQPLVEIGESGRIGSNTIADRGTVWLSADAAAGIVDNVINVDGIVQARAVSAADGRIVLSSDGANAALPPSAQTIVFALPQDGHGDIAVRSYGQNVAIGGETGLRGTSVDLALDGSLTLTKPIAASGSGDSVILSTPQFVNAAGSAGVTPGSGRFLIYSEDPAAAVVGGLPATALYGRTFADTPPASLPAGGNFLIFAGFPAPPLPVSASPLANLTAQQIVQATLGPYYEIAGAASSAAVAMAAPPKNALVVPPPQPVTSGDSDVLFSNDGNHDLWGLGIPPSLGGSPAAGQ